jgi:hypothetical protein
LILKKIDVDVELQEIIIKQRLRKNNVPFIKIKQEKDIEKKKEELDGEKKAEGAEGEPPKETPEAEGANPTATDEKKPEDPEPAA